MTVSRRSLISFAQPLPRLWLWPAALGVLTASGLVSALVSDGWGDAWAWLALGTVVAVMAWFSVTPARRRADGTSAGAGARRTARQRSDDAK